MEMLCYYCLEACTDTKCGYTLEEKEEYDKNPVKAVTLFKGTAVCVAHVRLLEDDWDREV